VQAPAPLTKAEEKKTVSRRVSYMHIGYMHIGRQHLHDFMQHIP
jgi:hypothetical protein